jgi:hypothetical protein
MLEQVMTALFYFLAFMIVVWFVSIAVVMHREFKSDRRIKDYKAMKRDRSGKKIDTFV